MRTLPVALLVFLLGCPTDDPADPAGGPCDLGTSADDAAYAAVFEGMGLVRADDGTTPDTDDERGALFTGDETVAVLAEATAAADVAFCVRTRDGASTLVDSVETAVVVGEQTIALDAFSAGDYVVRVGLDGVLIRNLTFGVD